VDARESRERIGLDEIDLILVPGLAFSRTDRARLGQGGGFYDRLLRGALAQKIGVCFKQQLLAEIPAEPHDERVDQIACWA
jgi:5-formyltetrahydrofolate cyclo-ligase